MKQEEQEKLLCGMSHIGDSTLSQFAHRRHSSGHAPDVMDSQAAAMTSRIGMRNPQWLVTDGPFAETHELLGG